MFKTPGLGCERLNLYSDFLVQYKPALIKTCKDNKVFLYVLLTVIPTSPKTTIAQKCDGKADGSQEENIRGPLSPKAFLPSW